MNNAAKIAVYEILKREIMKSLRSGLGCFYLKLMTKR